ncbi:MAG: hypothetical protein QNJ54_34135 [Prochloraceae cyanobacterium]|nr:hypothetical protein [Prochloraceae cyanobacterium]
MHILQVPPSNGFSFLDRRASFIYSESETLARKGLTFCTKQYGGQPSIKHRQRAEGEVGEVPCKTS